MLDIDRVLEALQRAGCQPKRSGSGWQALCPAHDDTTPSLSVSRGDKQEVLLHCFAGCEFGEILAALGLDGGGAGHSDLPAGRSAPAKARSSGPVAARVWRELPAGPGVSRYAYRGEEGELVGVVIREDRGDAKTIRPFVPAEGGGWIQRGMPAPRPLYRLPELVQAAGAVAVVEGEKCVGACLRAWPGKPAVTTWAHGTGSWRKTDWSPLAGRGVSLLADADEAGRKAVRGIAARLAGMGCAVRVGLPEGETGEDVADWLEDEGPDATLERVAGLLEPFGPPPGPGR